MNIFNRKITIEVKLGKKKAKVKILALTEFSEARIVRNFNEIIEKNKIKYKSVISDELTCSDYAPIFKLIQDEMLERKLEIIIYSFEKVKNEQNLFNTLKHIFLIIIIITIILMALNYFKPDLFEGVVRLIKEAI